MCYTVFMDKIYYQKEGTDINTYKDKYKVVRQRGKNGKPTANKDDTYIPARKGVEVYRYNADTLAVSFNTAVYARNRIREIKDAGIKLKTLQLGDDESAYLFSVSDLDKVAKIVQARRRIVLTEEEKERRKLHMQELHKKHKKTYTNTRNNVE